MTAEAVAKALGGRRAGGGWTARCPAHNDREPSLSILDKNGKVLVRCHAGCSQADVIASLRSRGLWEENGHCRSRFTSARPHVAVANERCSDEEKRKTAALAIWQSSLPSAGSPIETYLQSRGIHLPAPPSLRFCAALKHPAGGLWSGMVALVTRGCDGAAMAVHRTFLARDGAGKAPVEPQKMMLGPCRGGAVRLAEAAELVMVGEGIETCLAAMQATGQPAWAALSTSGLRGLHLPAEVREVIVLADGDDPGEAAARDCARRWRREGRRVRIARPPNGLDFNDMLMGTASAPCIGEVAQ